MNHWRVYHGDVRERLQELPAQSVQCVVTSPPYWGLRDYGHDGQIGLEPTPDAYVQAMVRVFAEVRRVLKDDGVVWLNLGDSYNGSSSTGGLGSLSGGGALRPNGRSQVSDASLQRREINGLKPKDLCGIPWRVAFALQADGWYLRSDIIWSKPNPMPESVTDRPTKAHEYIFLLSKSERYYYDAEAISEEQLSAGFGGFSNKTTLKSVRLDASHRPSLINAENDGRRNKRSVWHVATQPYPDAHFATYPEKLIEPCILAGTSEKGCCPSCSKPWVRITDDGELVRVREGSDTSGGSALEVAKGRHGDSSIFTTGSKRVRGTLGWEPSCSCNAGDPIPCTVLDPFTGSGTTGAVALKHQRNFIGIELNAAYVELARKRIGGTAPLFAEERTA